MTDGLQRMPVSISMPVVEVKGGSSFVHVDAGTCAFYLHAQYILPSKS